MEASPKPEQPSHTETDDLYEAAANVGRDSVLDQIVQMDTLRARAVQFLAFVGTGTAFLVGTAIAGKNPPVGQGFAYAGSILSFGFLVILKILHALLVGTSKWWSFKCDDWEHQQDATLYTRWIDDHKNTMTKRRFYIYLASVYEGQVKQNNNYLDKARNRFVLFLGLCVMELFAWAILAWHYGAKI